VRPQCGVPKSRFLSSSDRNAPARRGSSFPVWFDDLADLRYAEEKLVDYQLKFAISRAFFGASEQACGNATITGSKERVAD
jgi:hypothetical protein